MIVYKRYKITVKIKVHTSPLYELVYERTGLLIKETPSFYIFDTFRVKKANVIGFQEVGI